MLKKKENVSTVMLLPVVKLNKKTINNFYKFGFKNTFLNSEQLSWRYKFEVIYLLFEPTELNLDFEEFLFSLSDNQNFIEVIDVGYKQVLAIFRIPVQFKSDFKTFLEGKYSKLSEAYKKCFSLEKPVKNERGDVKRSVSGNVIMEPSTFFHIFNRTEKLKSIYREKLGLEDFEWPEDLELYDKIDEKKETLNNLILF